MRIVRLEKTCGSYPAQWEGELKDGRCIYIRYRYGNFGIGVGKTIGTAVDEGFYMESIGDPYDGCMTTKEMLKLLRGNNVKVSIPLWIKAMIPKIKLVWEDE